MNRLEPPVNADHLKLIGRVAVNHAALELIIKDLIREFLKVDQRTGHIITAELGFRQLLQLLSSLARERHKDDKKIISEIDNLINRAGCVSPKRDKIIHSIWCAGKTLEEMYRAKVTAKKKGFNLEFEKVTPSDLQKIAEDLAVLSKDFYEIANKLHISTLGELVRLRRTK